MSQQPGRNSGITQLVDLPGVGGGAKFEVRVFAYDIGMQTGRKNRLGRGTENWGDSRPLLSSGSVALSGKVRLDGWPLPDQFRGERGTLRQTFSEGVYADYPILITAARFAHSQPNQSVQDITLAADITGEPTLVGFAGTQPAHAAPAASDRELYDGTSKTVDPNGLVSQATRVTDVWGDLADTDAAEEQRLADVVAAAAAPFDGLKLKYATFARDSVDGGTVTEVWALTDTVEDVENPGTVTTTDESSLSSSAQVTVVEDDATSDGGVTVAGLVLRHVSKRELNDGKWAHTYHFGETTTEQDVEFPGTVTSTDPKALVDSARVTLVSDSGTYPTSLDTPPTGLKLRAVSSRQLTDSGKWVHAAEYGRRSTEDDVEFDGTTYDVDESSLAGRASVTVVESDATPDGGVTVAGLVLRNTTRRQLTDGKWAITYHFAELSTEQSVEFPGTVTATDPSNLIDQATVTLVNDSSTHPASLDTPPAGLKLRTVASEQMTDSGRWRHTATYGLRSTEDDVEFEGTTYALDESSIESTASVTVVEPDSTPDGGVSVSGLVLRRVTKRQLTDGKWAITYGFAERTSEQDVEFPGTVTAADPSSLIDRATVTLVTDSGTYPASLDTPPAGLKLRSVSSEQLTDSGKWRHAGEYARRSSEQDVTFPGTVADDDASDLADERTITIVDDSTPAAPSTPSGYKLVSTLSEQLTDAGRWRYRYLYRRRTNQEAVEFDGSNLTDDASDLADEQTVVLIQSASVATATPPATPTGLKLRDKSSRQIHDASTGAKWRNTYVFARTTREDDAEFGGSLRVDDASGLETRYEIAVVEADATPDGLGGSAPAGLVLRDTRKRQLTDGKWLITYVYGETTREQDVEFPGSFTVTDPKSLITAAKLTVVNDSDTHAFDDPLNGLKLRGYRSTQLTDSGKYRHEADYGLRDTEDDVEQDGTEYRTDASSLASTARVTVVEDDATPDGGVTVTGLVQRGTEAKQLHDGKWAVSYLFGERTTEEDEEFPGTVAIVDPDGLADEATVTLVTDSGTYPVALDTPPTGLKLRGVRSEQLTNGGKWKHTGEYGRRDRVDDVEMEGTSTTDDPSDLADEQVVTLVTASETPIAPDDTDGPVTPSGLYHRETQTRPLHDGKWSHRYTFARRTREDDVELGGTEYATDQSANVVAGSARVTVVESDVTSDGGVSVSGLVLRDIEKRQIRPGKWAHTYVFGQRTHEQDETFGNSLYENDPDGLESKAVVVMVNGSNVYPVALDTPPTVPTTGTLQLRGIVSRQHTDGGKWVHRAEYGLRTAAEDLEYRNGRARGTVGEGLDVVEASVVSHSDTAEALVTSEIAANQADPTFDGVEVIKLTADRALKMLRFTGGDKSIRGGGNHAMQEMVRGIPSGAYDAVNNVYKIPSSFVSTASTAAYVYINYNGGNLQARQQIIWRARGRFTLRRVWTPDLTTASAAADWQPYQFLALRGVANDDEFLGFSIGEVIYAGPSLAAYTFELSGARRLIADYDFQTDNWKHFSDAWLPAGTTYVNSGTVSASGMYLASQFEAGYGVAWPPQGDFSGFLA